MQSIILTTITSVIVFLLVILIHEFGHFAVAKLVGIQVNEFSIGMGPSLYSKRRGETKYSIRALPIGGYVAMEGEDEESFNPRSFNKSPVSKRIAVILAGAIMNFILALVVLFIIGFSLGTPVNSISEFTENSPAQVAGMQVGDKIIRVEGIETKTWTDVTEAISKSDDKNITITVQRSNENIDLNVTRDEDGKVGIMANVKRSISGAIAYSIQTTIFLLNEMIKFFGRLFRGSVSINEVSGPVGIISEIGNAARTGVLNVLLILAFININVGFFNLLPIPALDGSKVIILLIEAIRKKPIPQEKEGIINLIGFIFLIGLLIVVTFKDIIQTGIFGG